MSNHDPYSDEKAKQEQAITRGRLGWSLRRIEQATGIRGDSSQPANEVTTGFFARSGVASAVWQRSFGASEAYRELIELELSPGRKATGIWQDLVDRRGFTGGYQSVKRLVRKLRGAASPDARVITKCGLGCCVSA